MLGAAHGPQRLAQIIMVGITVVFLLHDGDLSPQALRVGAAQWLSLSRADKAVVNAPRKHGRA